MKKFDFNKIKHIEISIGGIKKVEILLFTKHLSVVLKSGLTITEGLEIMIAQVQGKLKKVLLEISSAISNGKPFYEALGEHPKEFSPFYVNMIKTGEYSGNLEDNLKRIAIHLEKAEKLKKKVKSAMIYPGIIFTAIVGIGIAIATFVLPKILPLFENMKVELPPTTKVLVFVAKSFESYGIHIMAGTFVVFIFSNWLLRQKFMKPMLHQAFLYTPTLKTIVKNINIQRFTSTLSILLKSGMTIDDSLRIIADAIDNRIYSKAVAEFIPEIESGKSIEMVLNAKPDLFPPLITRMVGVGEATGSLDDTLQYLGDYYEELVDDTVKNLSSIIEPVILIIVGVVVGVVALAIIGPLGQLNSSIT